MAATTQTPRQKMIAMMYLVMMALLALNVSKEVIDAFIVVDENIILSNDNFKNKLKDIYSNFEENYILAPEKVRPYWQKAMIARFLSAEMVAYINKVRNELVAQTENVSIDSAENIRTKDLKMKDDNTISTNYFLGTSDDGSGGEARVLKGRINEYRKKMLALVDPNNKEFINLGLNTEGPFYDADGNEQNWESHFFLHTIIAADIPILNKMILDVYNAELEVVNSLHKSVGQGDFKFEKIEAKVLPQSNFVFLGEEYKAEVIVAAFDTSHSPEIWYMQNTTFLDSTQMLQATLLKNDSGRVRITFPASEEGIKQYAGFVRTKSNEGFIQDFPFSGEYIVSRPSANIAAIKMNVLYAGVDNPVSLTVSGIAPDSITPVISAGTIKRDAKSSNWIVTVPSTVNSTQINTFATLNGAKKNMGSMTFRVKKIPNPVATIAGKNTGAINKNIIIAAGAISPQLPEDFDFDFHFVVNSFTMTLQRGFKTFHYNSPNAYLTEEMIDEIRKTNRGQSLVFENIATTDPFKVSRTLTPIVLTME